MNRKRELQRIGVLVVLGLLLLPSGLAAAPSLEVPAAGVAGTRGAAGAVAAQFDSVWTPIAPGACATFAHNLGGDPEDYAVDLWFRDTDAGGLGIHRRGYGGLDVNGLQQGAHWQLLTDSHVSVCRAADDPVADQVRIRVWVPAPPDYASNWTAINPGQTIVFPHSLGVDADQLTVGLWFRSTTRGIHSLGYGGLPISASQEFHGAAWHHLTDNDVAVTRHADDVDITQVRVEVTQADPPAWDSTWVPLAVGSNLLTHNLNWNPNLLLVRAECRSPGQGIHQRFAGGAVHWNLGAQGVHLQNLGSTSLVAVRWPDDQLCPEARVRIWKRGPALFLPLIVNGWNAP